MESEVAAHADFGDIRYAQVWEDAEVLLEALAVQPGEHCLSICSAGDNALALLTRNPARVVAVDLSAAQLACLELRVAAFRVLEHGEVCALIGSRPCANRLALYRRCRLLLGADARVFWDAREHEIASGIGHAGRFERYLASFRRRLLPLIHGRRKIARVLEPKSREAREVFYREEWDTWRWRMLFRVFFSRLVLGRNGRDPAFFRYVEGPVAERLLDRARHALTELDPATNSYLRWILTGTHARELPVYLRAENFDLIRARLDRLEWRQGSLEDYAEGSFSSFNLSDIFEYMSPARAEALLESLLRVARPGARLAYWNMLVPRSRPASLADRLDPQTALAARLHARDRAFVYSAFHLEVVR